MEFRGKGQGREQEQGVGQERAGRAGRRAGAKEQEKQTRSKLSRSMAS